MTLLARRRDELAARPGPGTAEAEDAPRGPVVRPRPRGHALHHVQEALGNRQAQRLLPPPAAEPRPTRRPATDPVLVADEAVPLEHQMRRSDFVDAMARAARGAAEEALARTPHTARDCPWIAHYVALYRRLPAARLEADLRRWVGTARHARDAAALVAAGAAHVRRSVFAWARDGDLSGAPRGLPGLGLVAAVGGGSLATAGRVLRKARNGHAAGGGEAAPGELLSELGPGRPFGGAPRGRMEGAFRRSFAGVRLHVGTTAARVARRLGARAFAVGRHVAFDRGEYRPGTPVGDALLAHELAHVAQQRSAERPAAAAATPSPAEADLERDADRAAGGVVRRLWGPARGARRSPVAPRPGMHTGLALQRCEKKGTKKADEWVELVGGEDLTAYRGNQRVNPVWNAGSTDHAAAYVKGTDPKVDAQFKVAATMGGAANSSVQVRALERGSVRGNATATKTDLETLTVRNLALSGLTASDRVGTRDYDLAWQVRTANDWLQIEETDGHRIHWLYSDRLASPLYVTGVEAAARYAEQQTSQSSIAAALRHGPRGVDGLRYHPGDEIDENPLEVFRNGVGICTDYANLLATLAWSLGLPAKTVLYWGGFTTLGRNVFVRLEFNTLKDVRSPNPEFNPDADGWDFSYHAIARVANTLHDAALDRTGVSGRAVHDGVVVRLVELDASQRPPDATVGTPYSYQIRRVDHRVQLTTEEYPGLLTGAMIGGSASMALPAGQASPVNIPVAWSTLAGSSLPDGLTLNPMTGEITGTPTTAGTHSFRVETGAAGLTDGVTLVLRVVP